MSKRRNFTFSDNSINFREEEDQQGKRNVQERSCSGVERDTGILRRERECKRGTQRERERIELVRCWAGVAKKERRERRRTQREDRRESKTRTTIWVSYWLLPGRLSVTPTIHLHRFYLVILDSETQPPLTTL